MNQNTKRRGRLLLLAVVTILVTFAGGSAAARAITDDQDEPRTSGLQYVTQTTAVEEISHATVVVPCPAGTTAIDGGVSSDSESFTRVVTSAADTGSSGWRVELWNQHPSRSLTAYGWAACLAVG
jgi:hypothetical protein